MGYVSTLLKIQAAFEYWVDGKPMARKLAEALEGLESAERSNN